MKIDRLADLGRIHNNSTDIPDPRVRDERRSSECAPEKGILGMNKSSTLLVASVTSKVTWQVRGRILRITMLIIPCIRRENSSPTTTTCMKVVVPEMARAQQLGGQFEWSRNPRKILEADNRICISSFLLAQKYQPEGRGSPMAPVRYSQAEIKIGSDLRASRRLLRLK